LHMRRDGTGFWLARWLRAQKVEAHAVHLDLRRGFPQASVRTDGRIYSAVVIRPSSDIVQESCCTAPGKTTGSPALLCSTLGARQKIVHPIALSRTGKRSRPLYPSRNCPI
jgi:hypothetical protein